MFSPSTAPRWKIAIRTLRRPPAAFASRPITTRSRNDGAESDMPKLAIAILPDFRKTLRFITSLLLPLKLRRAQYQSHDLCDRISRVHLFNQRLPGGSGHFYSENHS